MIGERKRNEYLPTMEDLVDGYAVCRFSHATSGGEDAFPP